MSSTTKATRTLNDVELPAPGKWILDPGHAEVAFIGRHFMLTRVRGRFPGVEGAIDIADEPNESSLSIEIEMSSVHSGDQARDDHLRSADFFDVKVHPKATFTSTAIDWSGTTGQLSGLLVIRDVARPVDLDVEYLGHVEDPWGNDRAAFSASGRINREDWDLTWNMFLESGGVVVSKEIDIDIQAEFVREV